MAYFAQLLFSNCSIYNLLFIDLMLLSLADASARLEKISMCFNSQGRYARVDFTIPAL